MGLLRWDWRLFYVYEKKNCISLTFLIFSLIFPLHIFSAEITVKCSDGDQTVSIPDDVAIALGTSTLSVSLTKEEMLAAGEAVTNAWTTEVPSIFSTSSPISTLISSADNFSADSSKSLGNAQFMQNQWAQAYIGPLLHRPPHFGFGVNAGVAKLNLSSLKRASDILKCGLDLPENFILPTVSADIRLGGIIIPLDIGFQFMTLDLAKIGLKNILPGDLDFFNAGGDVRFCFFNKEGKPVRPQISVGAGYHYSKINLDVSKNNSGAAMKFENHSIDANIQISSKLGVFIPYVGFRTNFLIAKSRWKINTDWKNLLNISSTSFINAIAQGLLPSSISSSSDNFYVQPIAFFGFALDLSVINLTFSGSWDFASSILSGGFSFRIAL